MEQLITDRTAADVERRTAKGVYGTGDLNRVERATGTLAVLLGVAVQTYTEWDIPVGRFGQPGASRWPTATEMERYLGNVRAVCTTAGVPLDTLPQNMNNLTYQGANAIEQALQAAYDVAHRSNFAGEIYAGEERST